MPSVPFNSQTPHFVQRVGAFCAKVLPLVFDNSLSYYEQICRFSHKLNECIDAINAQNLNIIEFTKMVSTEIERFELYIETRQGEFEEEITEEFHALQDEWATFRTQIETDIETMQAAVAAIQALVAQIQTGLADEIAARTAADSAESAARVAGDNANAAAIVTAKNDALAAVDAESNLRQTGDNNNATAINAETETRAQQYQYLLDLINGVTGGVLSYNDITTADGFVQLEKAIDGTDLFPKILVDALSIVYNGSHIAVDVSGIVDGYTTENGGNNRIHVKTSGLVDGETLNINSGGTISVTPGGFVDGYSIEYSGTTRTISVNGANICDGISIVWDGTKFSAVGVGFTSLSSDSGTTARIMPSSNSATMVRVYGGDNINSPLDFAWETHDPYARGFVTPKKCKAFVLAQSATYTAGDFSACFSLLPIDSTMGVTGTLTFAVLPELPGNTFPAFNDWQQYQTGTTGLFSTLPGLKVRTATCTAATGYLAVIVNAETNYSRGGEILYADGAVGTIYGQLFDTQSGFKLFPAVSVDGTTITQDAQGVLHSTGGGGSVAVDNETINFNAETELAVKVSGICDANTITVNNDGKLQTQGINSQCYLLNSDIVTFTVRQGSALSASTSQILPEGVTAENVVPYVDLIANSAGESQAIAAAGWSYCVYTQTYATNQLQYFVDVRGINPVNTSVSNCKLSVRFIIFH